MIKQFSAEQNELRTTVRDFFDRYSPEAEVRRLMATEKGYDPASWQKMAEQLGLQGILVPEEYGGLGFGWVELGIVLEEAGRALVCAPLLSSVIAGATVLAVGDERAKRRLLPGIAAGTRFVTVALPGDGTAASVRATRDADGWTITGSLPLLLDGHIADTLLVPAATDEGAMLFEVDTSGSQVTAVPQKTLDQTRRLADVTVEGAAASAVGDAAAWSARAGHVRDLALVALAAEQVGVAQAALDMAVEYMKVRVQFGQPIGAFQALKHMAADVFVEVETARSAAYYALGAAADASDELPAAAALAAAYCADASVTATHQNIQFHGGMGFTWEVPAHLYFKRARSNELLMGEPAAHRERLAQILGV